MNTKKITQALTIIMCLSAATHVPVTCAQPAVTSPVVAVKSQASRVQQITEKIKTKFSATKKYVREHKVKVGVGAGITIGILALIYGLLSPREYPTQPNNTFAGINRQPWSPRPGPASRPRPWWQMIRTRTGVWFKHLFEPKQDKAQQPNVPQPVEPKIEQSKSTPPAAPNNPVQPEKPRQAGLLNPFDAVIGQYEEKYVKAKGVPGRVGAKV
jgi:hypothetical protein